MNPQRRHVPRRGDALSVSVQLTQAADRVAAELQPMLGAEGLTAGQLGVLDAIGREGPMSLRDLGDRLYRSGPNMTIVVDNLERADLVRRVRSAIDRRVVLVENTTEGRRRLRRAFPAYARAIAAFMSPLGPAEQAQLARLCQKLKARPVAPRKSRSTSTTSSRSIHSRTRQE